MVMRLIRDNYLLYFYTVGGEFLYGCDTGKLPIVGVQSDGPTSCIRYYNTILFPTKP